MKSTIGHPERIREGSSRLAREARSFASTLRMTGLVGILLVIGCRSGPDVHPIHIGPTLSMYEVVTRINENNRPLASLWARHEYEATVVDENKKSHFVNGDGVMLMRKPRELRILGNKPLAGRVFEIGSTSDRFWLTLEPEISTMWWGNYKNLGKPCTKEIPIRPDLVLEVLGVGDIDPNFNNEPAPTMRFNNDSDAYMLVWNVHATDRWIAQKEIWYDRQTLRPKLVLLFDENGRVVLRAYLAKHMPVQVAELPKEKWPVIATDYRLFFPDSQTKMSFSLRDVALQYKGVPKEGSIRFPAESGVSKEIQIDADCGE